MRINKIFRVIFALALMSPILILSQPHSSKMTAKTGGQTDISFVGNGDIQKSISLGSKIEANTGLGIIFFRKFDHSKFQNIEFDFVINVASTSDSLNVKLENGIITSRRDFGSYIINPLNSRQATTFNFNAYLNNTNNSLIKGDILPSLISGIHVRFSASNSVCGRMI